MKIVKNIKEIALISRPSLEGYISELGLNIPLEEFLANCKPKNEQVVEVYAPDQTELIMDLSIEDLKRHLSNRDLNLAGVARKIGCTRSFLCAIRNNRINTVSKAFMFKFQGYVISEYGFGGLPK